MADKLWFRRKRYGWGWQPVSWEGWTAVTIVLVIILILAANVMTFFETTNGMLLYYSIIVVLIGILIGLGFWKGEKPKWQWGR